MLFIQQKKTKLNTQSDSSKAKLFSTWALFKRREGNPTARVTLIEGSKIARVYKQGLTGSVTLSPGTTLNDLGNRTRLETSKNL